jgi:hypothetical protein
MNIKEKPLVLPVTISMEQFQAMQNQILGFGVVGRKMKTIVDAQFEQFPNINNNDKKFADYTKFSEIRDKNFHNEILTKDELRFLYQIDAPIAGLEELEDEIEEIIKTRDIKSDISLALGCSKAQVSLDREHALKGGPKKFHYGNLDFSLFKSFENHIMILPEIVCNGNVVLPTLKSAKNVTLPQKIINGKLDLSDVTDLRGLVLPKRVDGYIELKINEPSKRQQIL